MDITGIVNDLLANRERWSHDESDTALTEARIEMTSGQAHVWGTSDAGVEKVVFSYYTDELHFAPAEFVGMTVEQARDLHRERDVRFLQT